MQCSVLIKDIHLVKICSKIVWSNFAMTHCTSDRGYVPVILSFY